MEEQQGVTFTGMVSAFRTDAGGGFKLTIFIPDSEPLDVNKILALKQSNIQVAIVALPQE